MSFSATPAPIQRDSPAAALTASMCHLLAFFAASSLAAGATGDLPTGYTALPRAVQTIYQDGVPHTDRNGNRLTVFDAAKSYLPLVLYDPQLPCNASDQSSVKGQTCLPKGFDASLYEQANYTGVLPYGANHMSSYPLQGMSLAKMYPKMGQFEGLL